MNGAEKVTSKGMAAEATADASILGLTQPLPQASQVLQQRLLLQRPSSRQAQPPTLPQLPKPPVRKLLPIPLRPMAARSPKTLELAWPRSPRPNRTELLGFFARF